MNQFNTLNAIKKQQQEVSNHFKRREANVFFYQLIKGNNQSAECKQFAKMTVCQRNLSLRTLSGRGWQTVRNKKKHFLPLNYAKTRALRKSKIISFAFHLPEGSKMDELRDEILYKKNFTFDIHHILTLTCRGRWPSKAVQVQNVVAGVFVVYFRCRQ